MRVTRWRALARKAGLPGMLLAGAYVAARLAWSKRPVRWAALTALACLVVVWVVGAPHGRGVSSSAPSSKAVTSPLYDIVDLGTQGEGVAATGINAQGDVSGVCLLSERQWHAVLWRNGKMRDLGTLGGARSLATGINVGGQVSGQSETASRGVLGFRWRPAGMQPLPSLDNRASAASAINARGEIAGFSTSQGSAIVACLWREGKPQPLDTPAGYQFGLATSIDEQGQVAGCALSRDRIRAFVWDAGRPRDLGTLGGDVSIASAVQSATVGGASTVTRGEDAEWHACLWENGKLRDLGLLPGAEWAVVAGLSRKGGTVGSSGVG